VSGAAQCDGAGVRQRGGRVDGCRDAAETDGAVIVESRAVDVERRPRSCVMLAPRLLVNVAGLNGQRPRRCRHRAVVGEAAVADGDPARRGVDRAVVRQ